MKDSLKHRNYLRVYLDLFHWQYVANRWLGVRLEVLGGLSVTLIGIISVWSSLSGTIDAGVAALCLTYSLAITGNLNWMIRQLADAEVSMNAAERVNHYIVAPPLEAFAYSLT